MTNDLQRFYNLPEISFIEGISYESILDEMVADYQAKYAEETGREATLQAGDEEHIHLKIVAWQFYQMYQQLDYAAKMNLLRYSTGPYLEHLGALKKVFPEEPRAAVCKVRFSLSEIRREIACIPKGTRVTAGDGVYFATNEYMEIPAGEAFIDIDCTCEETGAIGNDYIPGQIKTIVDPIPYVESAENITESEGGSDKESEERYRERIFLAPSSYSVAGPADAYEYWIRKYNSAAIEDIKIHEASESAVDIRILLLGGALPDEAFCSGCVKYLQENPIIPLTDKLSVSAPDVVEYSLKATYYISKSYVGNIDIIRKSIEEAKDAYLNWQKTKIGRDINPDTLTEFVRAAGGKRISIESPNFTVVPEASVAVEQSIDFVYGGIEDD